MERACREPNRGGGTRSAIRTPVFEEVVRARVSSMRAIFSFHEGHLLVPFLPPLLKHSYVVCGILQRGGQTRGRLDINTDSVAAWGGDGGGFLAPEVPESGIGSSPPIFSERMN